MRNSSILVAPCRVIGRGRFLRYLVTCPYCLQNHEHGVGHGNIREAHCNGGKYYLSEIVRE